MSYARISPEPDWGDFSRGFVSFETGELLMLKHEVSTRTLYLENPLTAGHPVKGTQVTILAVETDGPCLVGDSPVEWDEAAKKNISPAGFAHYEHHSYSEEEAVEVAKGKIAKLIADGYVFEPYPDMDLFIRTGQWVVKVRQHPRG
jgi:hypothetical protein